MPWREWVVDRNFVQQIVEQNPKLGAVWTVLGGCNTLSNQRASCVEAGC